MFTIISCVFSDRFSPTFILFLVVCFKFWTIFSHICKFILFTCSPRVDSPRKVSRFAPLNRYYIIIDEVFFDTFLVIIYLLVVCKKKKNHSFWSTLIIYLLVVYKKNNNSFIWSVEYCWTQKGEYFSQKRIIVKGFRFTYVYRMATKYDEID